MHLRSGVGASTITQGAGPAGLRGSCFCLKNGEIWEFRERVEQQQYGFYMFLYGILSIEDLDFSNKEWQQKKTIELYFTYSRSFEYQRVTISLWNFMSVMKNAMLFSHKKYFFTLS